MNVSFCGVTSTALRLTRRARQKSCCALFRPLTSQDKPKSLPRVPFPAASIEVSEGGHVHGWGRSPSPSPLARGRAAENPIDEKLSIPYKPTQFQYRNALLRASRDTRCQAVKRSPCQPHWFYFPSAGFLYRRTLFFCFSLGGGGWKKRSVRLAMQEGGGCWAARGQS